MRYALVTMLAVGFLSVLPARAVETHAELLSQVQAADALSDLLTFVGDRAAVREGAMGAYLKEIDKLDEFEQSKLPPVRLKTMPYSQVFAGAVKFIKEGGEKYADPALLKLDDLQLLSELNALQTYNVQQFLFLNQKIEAAERVKAYLDSIKGFQGYQKWAAGKALAPVATTGPMTPELTIANARKLVASTRAAAWKRAQAKGMSQSDFDAMWAKKEAAFKSDVAKRVEGIAALSSNLGSTPAAPANTAVQNPGAFPNTNSGPVRSPAPFEYNQFTDRYADTYNAFNTTYGGAGVYRNYDKRIDDDNDQRVDGEYDRREDLNFDRRQNVQIDVRQGV